MNHPQNRVDRLVTDHTEIESYDNLVVPARRPGVR
jgi:hypothetical protein